MTRKKRTKPVADKGWYAAAIAAAGLTQNKVASLMGLSEGALSKTFDGRRQMTIPDACKLAAVLGQPLDVIVTRAGFSVGYRITLAPAE